MIQSNASSLIALVLSGSFAAQSALHAQSKLDARAFKPRDFKFEAFVDVAALVDNGIYDSIRTSVVGPMLQMAEREVGLEFDAIHTLRVYPEIASSDQDRPDHWQQGGVLTIECEPTMAIPQLDGYRQDTFSGLSAAIDDRGYHNEDPDMWLAVKPGLLVYGTQHLIEPVVKGTGTPGVPSAEFLTLTSGGRGLAHLVAELDKDNPIDLPFPLPEGLLFDDDKPRFVAIRLVPEVGQDDDPEDPPIVLEVIVRHEHGTKGPQAVKEYTETMLAEARKHPRFAALKHIWDKIDVSVDNRDVRARMALGRSRQAAGTITMMLAPMTAYMFASQEVAAPIPVAVPAAPVDPATPAAPDKVEEPDKSKDKKKQ